MKIDAEIVSRSESRAPSVPPQPKPPMGRAAMAPASARRAFAPLARKSHSPNNQRPLANA